MCQAENVLQSRLDELVESHRQKREELSSLNKLLKTVENRERAFEDYVRDKNMAYINDFT